MAKQPTVYLNPNEYRAIQLALANLLEKMRSEKTDQIPWNSAAKKSIEEIITAANSAAAKIEKVTGISATMVDYEEGDENKFISQPS